MKASVIALKEFCFSQHSYYTFHYTCYVSSHWKAHVHMTQRWETLLRPSEHSEGEIYEEVSPLGIIYALARAVFSYPIREVRLNEDELYGPFVEIEVEGDERKILEEWVKLIDVLKAQGINIQVYPKILGELNATPEEFGKFVGMGLAKMGIFLRGEKSFDIVEILREERGG